MTTAAPSSLLHHLVPAHFHASELFLRLLSPSPGGRSRLASDDASPSEDCWQNTYCNLSALDLASDIDLADSSGGASPHSTTATTTTKTSTDDPAAAAGAADREEEEDPPPPTFAHTYWRAEVASPAELDRALSTLTDWRFPAIPAFVRDYCAAHGAAARPVLRRQAARGVPFAAALLADIDSTDGDTSGGGENDDAAGALAPAEVADLLEKRILQADGEEDDDDRVFRVARVLRRHPLPRALPRAVHGFLGRPHGAALALCALRNPRNGADEMDQVHALVDTALAAAVAKRDGLRRTFAAYSPRAAAQCAADIDQFWLAAARAGRLETLRRFVALATEPCRAVPALADAVCAASADDDVALAVAAYHGVGVPPAAAAAATSSSMWWCCWAEAAARHGRAALLRALLLLPPPPRSGGDDDSEEEDRWLCLVDAAAAARGGETTATSCLCAVLDCLPPSAAVARAARRRVVALACRHNQEAWLRVLFRGGKEETAAAALFTREDLETVFLAAVETTTTERDGDWSAYFFVRERLGLGLLLASSSSSLAAQRSDKLLPAAAKFVWHELIAPRLIGWY